MFPRNSCGVNICKKTYRQDGPGKGEELDEGRCQDETGHGDAQGGADHHGVVDPGILIPGRGHAGQDAGTDGQKEADEPQLGRYGKGFGNDIVDGLAGILIRRPQVEDRCMADVIDVLGP